MPIILKDIGSLLNLDVDDVLTSVKVSIFDCRVLKVANWEEIIKSYMYYYDDEYKVILFDNAEYLSEIIQNKLLLPLEESKMQIKTIFNTKMNLLNTIQSRSMVVNTYQSKGIVVFPEDYYSFKREFLYQDDNTDVDEVLGPLYKGFIEGKSLLSSSGLIKEKSKWLDFFVENLDILANYVIRKELSEGAVTSRSFIAKQYLECEKSKDSLYIFLLKLEANGGKYDVI
jgi:hypothetical protein